MAKPPLIKLDDRVTCPTCGASVDLRDLAQVRAHEDPKHGPKVTPAPKKR